MVPLLSPQHSAQSYGLTVERNGSVLNAPPMSTRPIVTSEETTTSG